MNGNEDSHDCSYRGDNNGDKGDSTTHKQQSESVAHIGHDDDDDDDVHDEASDHDDNDDDDDDAGNGDSYGRSSDGDDDEGHHDKVNDDDDDDDEDGGDARDQTAGQDEYSMDENEALEDDDDDDDGAGDSVANSSDISKHKDNDEAQNPSEVARKQRKKIHKLSLAKTKDFNAELARRGVIYVARIPPKMTPTKIKALLSQFGIVTRVYLAAEDAAVRKRRRQLSANKNSGAKRYIEGWVEFAEKKIAKHVAQSLNTTPITNYKRSPHYGDLWCLKYLKRFQWSHLTEKVAYERRVREQKLRLETMQAKRESAVYKQLVEQGHKLNYIQKRQENKRKRICEPDQVDGGEESGRASTAPNEKKDPNVHLRHPSKPKQPRLGYQIKPIREHQGSASKPALLGAIL